MTQMTLAARGECCIAETARAKPFDDGDGAQGRRHQLTIETK
jgi:hypothetical protein